MEASKQVSAGTPGGPGSLRVPGQVCPGAQLPSPHVLKTEPRGAPGGGRRELRELRTMCAAFLQVSTHFTEVTFFPVLQFAPLCF